MNKCIILLALMFITLTPILTACGTDDDPITDIPVQPNPEEPGDNGNSGSGNDNGNNDNGNNEGENNMNRSMTIRVGGHSFDVTLEDNATARAFAALLPMTVTMNELNGNEKYHYLSENLPTDSYRPVTIRNGDLMLYGSNCVVLFYETFASSYSYTRLGKIENPAGLVDVLGRGNVRVARFSLSK